MNIMRVSVYISGYGVVTVYSKEEYELVLAAREFLEEGVVESCMELLAALEVVRKRRAMHVAELLDEKLAKVIASGKCPDLG